MLGHDESAEAGADPAHLRLQERPAARRRPHPRRALPAQPPLHRRAAAADRPRPRRSASTSSPGTQAGEFYGRLLPLLEFLVPAYVAEGKSHLTIAIGCTGGRHRSVTVADRIWRDLDGRDDVVVRVKHRDVRAGRPCGVLPPRIARPCPNRSYPSGACARPTATLEAVRGIDLEVDARRDLRLPRPQRGRQDDHGRDPRGLPRPRRRARSRSSARTRRTAGRAWRERIGIVLQSCRLEPYLTVARVAAPATPATTAAPRPVDEVIDAGRPRGARRTPGPASSPAASSAGSTSASP